MSATRRTVEDYLSNLEYKLALLAAVFDARHLSEAPDLSGAAAFQVAEELGDLLQDVKALKGIPGRILTRSVKELNASHGDRA